MHELNDTEIVRAEQKQEIEPYDIYASMEKNGKKHTIIISEAWQRQRYSDIKQYLVINCNQELMSDNA